VLTTGDGFRILMDPAGMHCRAQSDGHRRDDLVLPTHLLINHRAVSPLVFSALLEVALIR
jgi:hypothetical protein